MSQNGKSVLDSIIDGVRADLAEREARSTSPRSSAGRAAARRRAT
jgi:hypothetical protein